MTEKQICEWIVKHDGCGGFVFNSISCSGVKGSINKDTVCP